MDFRLSQIQSSTNCKKFLEDINLKKKYRYLVLTFNKNLLEVEATGKTEDNCFDLLKNLQTNRPQYILYHYDSPPRFNDKYILIAWVPNNNAKECKFDLYGSALMYVKYALEVESVLIVTDVNNINGDKLEKLMQNCLDCLDNKNIVQARTLPMKLDPRGLGCQYYDLLSKHKDKIALVQGMTGESTTFGTIRERAISLAVNLRKRGIKYGDVIGYYGHDSANCYVVCVATFFLGGIFCAIDTIFSEEDVTSMFQQVSPALVFAAPELAEKLGNILKSYESNAEIVVMEDSKERTSIFDMIQKTEEDDDFRPVEVESVLDTAIIVFTSGSTGKPKPVCHSHNASQYQYQSFATLKHRWETMVHYGTPHWTIYTKFLGVQLIHGGKRIIYTTLYDSLWHFATYQPTILFCSPPEVMTLCKVGRPANIDLSRSTFIIGGNTVDEDQAKLMNSVFYDANMICGYGFTEIPNGMTAFDPGCPVDQELKKNNPLSVGKALAGISYKIVDPDTEEILGPNQQGEIRMKTNFFSSGYWRGDALSFWDQYGWLKTGDIARYDDNHCLYILGRFKDMFKYQDWHVIPLITEKVVRRHPAVYDVAVIGIPHFIDGHHPMAVVVLRDGHNVSVEELIEYTDGQVHEYSRLRAGIKIVDKLPLASNGKVRKNVLQTMILNGM